MWRPLLIRAWGLRTNSGSLGGTRPSTGGPLQFFPRSIFGSLAMLVAMRRASSRVSSLAAARLPGLALEVYVGERLPIGVADDQAPPIQLGVGLVDGRRRREAALGQPS